FGPALSLGFASYGEYLDIDLSASWSSATVRDALNGELPDGLTIVEAETHRLNAPSIDQTLAGFAYSVSLERLPPGRVPDAMVTARLAEFGAATTFPITKFIKTRARTIDARLSVAIERSGLHTLHVQTAVTRTGTLKPHHVIATLFDLTDLEVQLLGVTKIGTSIDPSLANHVRVESPPPSFATP
ncbi:MAG: TIGR03936 family radical SAM-associated protein, partial [Proteobacteria bacterium]|nr:TIGR03936 family radical SAM-associated protein [Pseudomonadota bacterium]